MQSIKSSGEQIIKGIHRITCVKSRYIGGCQRLLLCIEGDKQQEVKAVGTQQYRVFVGSHDKSLTRTTYFRELVLLAPVVQTMDNAIRWINHYPLDDSIGFASVYPLDSDLSGG